MKAKESTIRGCELRHTANCGRSLGSTLPGAGELEEMIAFGGFATASAAGTRRWPRSVTATAATWLRFQLLFRHYPFSPAAHRAPAHSNGETGP